MTHRERVICDLLLFTRENFPHILREHKPSFVWRTINAEADKAVRDWRRTRRDLQQRRKRLLMIWKPQASEAVQGNAH